MRAALVGFTGFLLLGALCFSALMLRAEPIQRKLAERTQAAISGTGADWSNVIVDGRDVRLNGVAPSEAAKREAIETAMAVPGIRKVTAHIRIDALVSPYVWRLENTSEAIVLSGVVPDRVSKQNLHDLAQRSFGRPVTDQTRIARGAPDRGWLAAARFGIEQLARMEGEQVVLEDSALTLAARPKNLGAGDLNTGNPSTGGFDSARTEAFQAAAKQVLVSPFEAKLAIFEASAAATPAENDGGVVQVSVGDEALDGGTRLGVTECQQRIDALLTSDGIDFAPGRRDPTTESQALIAEIAEALAPCGRFTFEVAGHTDSTGQEAANLRLSEMRASAVAEALVESGLSGDRLAAVGHGASQPIADNATAAGRERNRRIEIAVKNDMIAGN